MKRVRFLDPAGSTRVGAWQNDAIHYGETVYDPADVRVLPPSEPSKVIGVGFNYEAHARERGASLPERPSLFLMAPNVLAGHGDTVTLPSGKERVEHEAELGVIVGEQCKDVPEANVDSVLAGFTCIDEISNRDDQYWPDDGPDLFRGKTFDSSLPVGPVVAEPEHVPDDAAIRLSVDGEVRQEASRADLVFDVAELVSSITELITLEPGDIISTGTPAGPASLAAGDTVSVEIEGIGTLRHSVDR